MIIKRLIALHAAWRHRPCHKSYPALRPNQKPELTQGVDYCRKCNAIVLGKPRISGLAAEMLLAPRRKP